MIEISITATEIKFLEDKDLARGLRKRELLPALEAGESVVLDFAHVGTATQSFVHALIGEALKRYGEDVLDRVEFKHCGPELCDVIELVVDYSLGGFPEVEKAINGNERAQAATG